MVVDYLYFLLIRHNKNQPMRCHLQQITKDSVHVCFREVLDDTNCGDCIELLQFAEFVSQQIDLIKLLTVNINGTGGRIASWENLTLTEENAS